MKETNKGESMSFINKLGLESVKKYKELQDISNRQHARILQLESEVVNLKDKISGMSDVPNLRNQLDYMNAKYDQMKADFARHA